MAQYTDEQKTEAVALYAEHGPTHVQQTLGIPKGTVTKWAQERGVQTVSQERNAAAVEAARTKWELRRLTYADDLAEVIDAGLARALHELTDGSANSGKNAMVSAATAIDKALLLSGEPTERRELTARRDQMLNTARENGRGLRAVS